MWQELAFLIQDHWWWVVLISGWIGWWVLTLVLAWAFHALGAHPRSASLAAVIVALLFVPGITAMYLWWRWQPPLTSVGLAISAIATFLGPAVVIGLIASTSRGE